MHFSQWVRCVSERQSLATEEAARMFAVMLDGGMPDLELGALLAALKMKGESPTELAGFQSASAARCTRLAPPDPDASPVVLPAYGGTADDCNLTALVALLLQRMGVAVLVHGPIEGHGRIATSHVLRGLGVLPCANPSQLQEQLDAERLAFAPTAVLSPGLNALLALRGRIGKCRAAQVVAKLLDPFGGASLRVLGIADAGTLETVRALFHATGERALLFQSGSSEPFADPRRRPRIELHDDGRAEILFEREQTASDASGVPAARDVRDNVAYIRRVLDGGAPVPLPVVNQLAACLYGARVTDDFMQAKALAAVHTHTRAAA